MVDAVLMNGEWDPFRPPFRPFSLFPAPRGKFPLELPLQDDVRFLLLPKVQVPPPAAHRSAQPPHFRGAPPIVALQAASPPGVSPAQRQRAGSMPAGEARRAGKRTRQKPGPAAGRSLWQPLDGVFVLLDVHDGHARDLADAALQVLVAGGHDVALVARHALAQAVICVRAGVRARQPLYARVLRHLGSSFWGKFGVLGPGFLGLARWREHRAVPWAAGSAPAQRGG